MMKTKTKGLLYLVIVMVVLSLSSFALAQGLKDLKGVQLNDGTVIHGKVLEANVNKVVVEKPDGSRQSVKFDDISHFLQDEPTTEATNELAGKKPAASSFEFGMVYHYFNYKEDLEPPLKSTENGWIPGLYINYTYKNPSIFYTKVRFSYASGDIDFDGSTQDGIPASFSNQSTTLIKFDWNLGYPISVTNDFSLIPYIGYGYRFWTRGNTKLVGALPALWIQEQYAWHYVPVGLKADYDIAPQWNISFSVAANFMFSGSMRANTAALGIGLPDTDFNLGNKIGFYSELPLTYKFMNNFGVVLTPWYEYSAFGQSGIEHGLFFEPASRTHQYGANLGISLSF